MAADHALGHCGKHTDLGKFQKEKHQKVFKFSTVIPHCDRCRTKKYKIRPRYKERKSNPSTPCKIPLFENSNPSQALQGWESCALQLSEYTSNWQFTYIAGHDAAQPKCTVHPLTLKNHLLQNGNIYPSIYGQLTPVNICTSQHF